MLKKKVTSSCGGAMGYIRGVDRGQRVLFPEALDEYVGADNPVRFQDAFVQDLDFEALDFVRAQPARTGPRGYDPRLRSVLSISDVCTRIRSSRRLEAETKRNVEVMWLTGRPSPDFETIADFRRDHVEQITGGCREFTRLPVRIRQGTPFATDHALRHPRPCNPVR